MRSWDACIVGAGFAGASTAYHLARRGERVLVCEREESFGAHASGLCAGIVRTVEPDPRLLPLTIRGARAIASPPDALGDTRFRPSGSLYLSPAPLRRSASLARNAGLRTRTISPPETAARGPGLAAGRATEALWCPEDGWCDPPELLGRIVRAAGHAGARFRWSAEVETLERPNGRITGVVTSGGPVRARTVVVAAGAWTGRLAERSGVPLPLDTYRRHLIRLDGAEGWDGHAPVVWDLARNLYARPDTGGVLASPGDEEPHPPGVPSVRWDVVGELGRRLGLLAPGLSDRTVLEARACLRTFAPDRLPVIGPDPRLEGLHWVAGLGGFGMTTGLAAGELAAALLEGERPAPAIDPAPYAPARLLDDDEPA